MRKTLLVLILVASSLMPAFSEGEILITLDAAIESAMKNSTDMEIAALELQQAVRSASDISSYIPALSLTGSGSIGGGLAGSSNPSWNAAGNFSLGISMDLGTDLIGLAAVNSAARAIANLNYAITTLTLKESVTTGYWSLASAKRSIESARTSLASMTRTLEDTRDAYRAGLATGLDLANAELNVLNYEYALKQYEDAYFILKKAFRILTGIEGEFDVTDFPEIICLNLPDASTLYAEYGENTSAVRLLGANVQAAEASLLDVKVNSYYPSVSLAFNYDIGGNKYHNYSSADGFSDSASATLSFSVPISSYIPGSSASNSLRNAEDSVAISKIQEKAGKTDLLNTIDEILTTLSQNRENIDLNKQRVEISEKTYSLASESYKAGLLSLSELQESMDSLSTARMALIDAEASYIQNLYTLAFTLNTDYESLVTLYRE